MTEIKDLPPKYQKQAIEKLSKQKGNKLPNIQVADVARSYEQKKSKYGNEKTISNGIQFDSKKEASFYESLLLREKAGEVSDIVLQPRFELQEAFTKNGKKYQNIEYVADFQYKTEGGLTMVVDVKGHRTAVYKMKKKMFEKKYPSLTITEV